MENPINNKNAVRKKMKLTIINHLLTITYSKDLHIHTT